MTLQLHGMASLSEMVGDLLIFRNLAPVDRRLPCFDDAWAEMGFASPRRPRKLEPAYARAAIWFLRRARALDRPGTPLRELLFIGDTALSDGQAFHNLARESGWSAWAFIGTEKTDEPLRLRPATGGVTLANRWQALSSWLGQIIAAGARVDEHTALLIDVDKTALAARGRNNRAIDKARLAALRQTAAAVLGPDFDVEKLQAVHHLLDQPRFHPLTGDNQDYLAYITLFVTAGVVTEQALLARVADGRLQQFADFLTWVDALPLPAGPLPAVHEAVRAAVRAGDPTPFKRFRRQEFRATLRRMGSLPEDVPLSRRLQEEICLTQEVREVALWARQRGALVMALSDKPDEAVLPDETAATDGLLPLHRVATHAVGESIAHLLPG